MPLNEKGKKIMKAMTREQYVKSLSKSQEEQIKEVLPIIQDCVTDLKQNIDSVARLTK